MLRNASSLPSPTERGWCQAGCKSAPGHSIRPVTGTVSNRCSRARRRRGRPTMVQGICSVAWPGRDGQSAMQHRRTNRRAGAKPQRGACTAAWAGAQDGQRRAPTREVVVGVGPPARPGVGWPLRPSICAAPAGGRASPAAIPAGRPEATRAASGRVSPRPGFPATKPSARSPGADRSR